MKLDWYTAALSSFMSLAIALTFGAGLLFFHPHPASVVGPSIDQLRAESVFIDVKNNTGDTLFSASGFILNSTEVVTARHATTDVKPGMVITVHFFNGDSAPGVVEWESKKADVALISTRVPSLYEPVKGLYCGMPPAGTPITAIGNPLQVRFGVFEGRTVSDRPLWFPSLPAGAPAASRAIYNRMKAEASFEVPFDSVAAPGESGGPVFDANGMVLGNVTAMLMESTGDSSQASTINIFTSSRAICGSELKG